MGWYLAEHGMELMKFYIIYHGGLHIGIRRKRYVYILDLVSLILVSCFMMVGLKIFGKHFDEQDSRKEHI